MTPRTPRQTAQPTSRTRPRLGWCTRCRAPIWGCLFDALPLAMDIYPLNQFGEMHALLTGHKTFLISNGYVWRRNTWAIATSPTGLGGLIARTHVCGIAPPINEYRKEKPPYYSDPPDF